jgi:hypothetical protein
MTPLAAKLVFLTSSSLGALSLGSTAYLVEHPSNFAAPPAPALESVTLPAMRPLPPEPTIVPEPVQLEPMTIIGSKAPLIAPRQRAVRAKPVKTKSLAPCSEWEDIGIRRVRRLCL